MSLPSRTVTVVAARPVTASINTPDPGLEIRATDEVTTVQDSGFRGTRADLVWPEPPSALVRVDLDEAGFSFWPDQVSADHPIAVTSLGVVITSGGDERGYAELAATVGRPGPSALAAIAAAPELDFPTAAARSRRLLGPTWLGLGRDLRIFGVGQNSLGSGSALERMWDWIAPQWHGEGVGLRETDGRAVRYCHMTGRGLGPHDTTRRRLRDGRLPILEATRDDGGIRYESTMAVALERDDLRTAPGLGTDFLLADGHSAGHMFTDDQQADFDRMQRDYAPEQETVLFLRVRATNQTGAPRYAFLKLPEPHVEGEHHAIAHEFDPATGATLYGEDRVACISSMDGEPAPREEIARLLAPGQTLTLDVRLPHRPISAARARALAARDVSEVIMEVEEHWRAKLDAAAIVELPERRISEMVGAGLLHLDLVTYGTDPDGTLAPTIGVYAPIGSESAPIMQFFDSVGRADLAERSLRYFLDKQHDDGFMQNFGGYMLETEAALWSFGEHWRYTRDHGWAQRVMPGLTRAVDYILRNRASAEAAGVPYGLIVGKTADPEDPFASFMLNGYACLGLGRAAEIAESLEDPAATTWRRAADTLRDDLRAAFAEAVAASPVVPLGDGSWVRTAPPWAGHPGPLALDRSGANWFTHGSASARDTLLGPLWLVAQEVLDARDPLVGELLDYHAELFHQANVAFSQPYYSPHLLAHLRRGEVAAFLSAYYTMAASLADPETYSFWEHYFHASPHKTHEEAWFCMQTRWMLYLEDGDTLTLLPGVPRAWLAPGQRIRLAGVRSHFGPLDLTVQVSTGGNRVQASVGFEPGRAPARVEVRLPHPARRRAVSVSQGTYDPEREILTLAPVADSTDLVVEF